MLSIGEFSKTVGVTVKALRYYDEIGLVVPAYIDPNTNYRYYDRSQLSKMILINRLKNYGFSLNDIRGIIESENQEYLLGLLKNQKEVLEKEINEKKLVMDQLSRHLKNFERTRDIMGYQNEYTATIVTTEDVYVIGSRQMMGVADFGQAFGVVFEEVAKKGATVIGQPMAFYYDEEFSPESSDIEVAAPVAESDKATRKVEGTTCVSTIHKGAYSSLADAYAYLVKWIGDNGYQMAGAPFEIYKSSHMTNSAIEDWETEIFFPINKG